MPRRSIEGSDRSSARCSTSRWRSRDRSGAWQGREGFGAFRFPSSAFWLPLPLFYCLDQRQRHDVPREARLDANQVRYARRVEIVVINQPRDCLRDGCRIRWRYNYSQPLRRYQFGGEALFCRDYWNCSCDGAEEPLANGLPAFRRRTIQHLTAFAPP